MYGPCHAKGIYFYVLFYYFCYEIATRGAEPELDVFMLCLQAHQISL
jgi:hypothetical protein